MSWARSLFSVACLGLCLMTVFNLAVVLSFPDFEKAGRQVYKSRCEQALDLAWDIMLIVVAFFLHYLLNCMDLFADYSTSSQRCLYTLFTAMITQGVLFYWRRTSEFNLWSLTDVTEPAKYLILLIHVMSYLQLIANSVFDEAIETYGFRNWSTNTSEYSDFETSSYFNKSQELARLEGRLPSSGGLLILVILFLAYPVMPMERALASLVLISYNFCTSTLDEQDYFYVRRHFFKKWDELLKSDTYEYTSTASPVPPTGALSRTSAESKRPTGDWPLSRSSSQESFYVEERSATVRNRTVTQTETRQVAARSETSRKSARSSRKL